MRRCVRILPPTALPSLYLFAYQTHSTTIKKLRNSHPLFTSYWLAPHTHTYTFMHCHHLPLPLLCCIWCFSATLCEFYVLRLHRPPLHRMLLLLRLLPLCLLVAACRLLHISALFVKIRTDFYLNYLIKTFSSERPQIFTKYSWPEILLFQNYTFEYLLANCTVTFETNNNNSERMTTA